MVVTMMGSNDLVVGKDHFLGPTGKQAGEAR